MIKKSNSLGIYLPIFVLSTLSAVVLRSIACLTQLDFLSGYFTSKTLITISAIIAAFFSLFFLTYIIIKKRSVSLIADFTSPDNFIPTGIVGVALVFIAVFFAISGMDALANATSMQNSLNPYLSGDAKKFYIKSIFFFIVGIAALASILHFILMITLDEKTNTARAKLGIATALFLSLYAAYLYFDETLPLNSPNKTTDQLAYLFSSLFFLYETRISIGREKWKGYVAFGLIAASLTAYSSIPTLIVYATKGILISNIRFSLCNAPKFSGVGRIWVENR